MQRSRAGLVWHVKHPKGVPAVPSETRDLQHLEGHLQQVLSPASLSDIWESGGHHRRLTALLDVPAELSVAIAECRPTLQNLPD